MGSFCLACLDCKEYIELIPWLDTDWNDKYGTKLSSDMIRFLDKHKTGNKIHHLILFNDRVAMDNEWEYFNQLRE